MIVPSSIDSKAKLTFIIFSILDVALIVFQYIVHPLQFGLEQQPPTLLDNVFFVFLQNSSLTLTDPPSNMYLKRTL